MPEGNAAHVPVDWDQILTTTMHNYRKTLTDNIFNSRPLLNYLMSKGRVRTIDDGVSIVEPLIYATNSDGGAYSQWDQLSVTPQEGISAAQYQWKQLYSTITISGLEEAQNNGRAAAINLLEAKVMQSEETLKNVLSGMLWAASPGANDFHSIPELVNNVNDGTSTIGGIVPNATGSLNQWWLSEVASVGAVDAAGLEAAMRNAYNSASDSGSDRVDSLFGGQDTFEFYESTLTPQVRYTDTSKANLGFQNLMFKNVPFYWDFDAPSGEIYGLNSKYVGLVIHSDRNFKQSPFSPNLSGSVASGHATSGATNAVDARVSFITTYGNLTIRNRRRCFRLHTISEA